MKVRKSITVILAFVLILALVIQITRLDGFMSEKENDAVMLINTQGKKLDLSLLSKENDEKYLIIYDKSIAESEKIVENVVATLEYMKKSYKIYTTDDFNGVDENYRNMILVMEDINNLKPLNEVFNMVLNGANIFFTNRLSPDGNFGSIAAKLGIIEYGAFTEFFGITLVDDIIVGSKGVTINDKEFISNSSVEVRLDKDAIVYAKSIEDGNLLWSKEYGDGEIFYFNGTMLGEKANRGLIAGVISLMGEDNIYPIIDSKTVYLDDFPSPAPDGIDEVIYDEYGRNIANFYRDIWWPDMIKVATKNNVLYTGALIGSYDDDTNNLQPEDILVSDSEFNFYVTELIAQNGELGIHGFNHQPLAIHDLVNEKLGYKRWPSKEKIIEGITLLQYFVNSKMGKYKMVAYVPPSNILTYEGVEALVASGVNIIASLYDKGIDEDAYEQEINIDEYGAINLPRISSGYFNSEEMRWRAINAVGLHGYISHFIHPDDILDPDRNGGKKWSEMIKEFDEFLSDFNNRYPWIQETTASQSANKFIKYNAITPYFEKGENYINIYCDNFIDEVCFILRTDKEIIITEGCEVKKIGDDSYLVKAKNAISKIQFKGEV